MHPKVYKGISNSFHISKAVAGDSFLTGSSPAGSGREYGKINSPNLNEPFIVVFLSL